MTIETKRVDFLEELIASVCGRPVMYAGNESFYAAMAYISGYTGACKDLNDQGEWDILTQFQEWLSARLSKPKNWVWISTIYDFYGEDDQVAFDNLPKLFKEFRESEGL